jgi:hypothetical protein
MTSYENVFAQQLENLIQQDDIVIGISASRNSMNVLNAIEVAINIMRLPWLYRFRWWEAEFMVDIQLHE